MTRGDDGSTRCINLPRCARTTQLKSRLWVALLVFPLNSETAVWSLDKLLVNRRCCNMCIDVSESATAKYEPGDCCTCECSTIRQVCVKICACFSEESRYSYLSLLIKRLSTHDLDLAVHGGPRFGPHTCQTLCRLADAAVTPMSEADE